MPKRKRYFRYRVTHVGPNFTDRIKIGGTLIDVWRGKSYAYQVENKGEISHMCTVELIGEVTEEATLKQL